MKKQELRDGAWINEAGEKVPVGYISTGERLKERRAYQLAVKACKLNKALLAMKEEFDAVCKEINAVMADEYKVSGEGKGNFMWFNFDRSIKIERSVNERIEFDDLTLKACKEELDLFLDDAVDSKHSIIKQLIIDAFATTRGKVDTKKVMSLLRYKGKVSDAHFDRSMELLEQSIRRPDSKVYYRVSLRQADGSYNVVDLNFSSI